jgi:hypothetical protein
VLRSYNVRRVVGDRYAGEFSREPFRSRGIDYQISDKPKTDIYRDVLPVINSKRCELLDLPRLSAQLCGLERRAAGGTRSTIRRAGGTTSRTRRAARSCSRPAVGGRSRSRRRLCGGRAGRCTRAASLWVATRGDFVPAQE